MIFSAEVITLIWVQNLSQTRPNFGKSGAFFKILLSYYTIEIYNGNSMSSLLWFWHGDNILLPNLARW
jgi:hypothetical protein